MLFPLLRQAGFNVFVIEEKGWLNANRDQFEKWGCTVAGLEKMADSSAIERQVRSWGLDDLEGNNYIPYQEMYLAAAKEAGDRLGFYYENHPFYSVLGKLGVRLRNSGASHPGIQDPEFTSLPIIHRAKGRPHVTRPDTWRFAMRKLLGLIGHGPKEDRAAIAELARFSNNFEKEIVFKLWPGGDGYGVFLIRNKSDAKKVVNFVRNQFDPHKGVEPQQYMAEDFLGEGSNYSVHCTADEHGNISYVAYSEKVTRVINSPIPGVLGFQEMGHIEYDGSEIPEALKRAVERHVAETGVRGSFHMDLLAPGKDRKIGDPIVGPIVVMESGDRMPGWGIARYIQRLNGDNLHIRGLQARGIDIDIERTAPERVPEFAAQTVSAIAGLRCWTEAEFRALKDILGLATDDQDPRITFSREKRLSRSEIRRLPVERRPDEAFGPLYRIEIVGDRAFVNAQVQQCREAIEALPDSLIWDWPAAYRAVRGDSDERSSSPDVPLELTLDRADDFASIID